MDGPFPNLIFNDEVIHITLLSFQISCTAVALATLMSLPLGIILGLKEFRGKQLILSIVNTLMGLPPVVVGLILYLLLSTSGPFGPLNLLYTPSAMILAQLIMAVPIVIGLSYSAIASIPLRVIEQTISLGATKYQLFTVLLKETRIGILASIVAAFGGAISEVGAIMIVGGNIRYYTRTLTTAILLYTSMGEFDVALTLGTILLVTAFLINIFLTFLQSRQNTTSRKKFRRLKFGD